MALGSYSPMLARTIGVDLPIYPIKGYSLTIPVGNHQAPPTIGSVDETNLVAISRFGDRVRVTATAEFAGYDTSHRPADFAFMTSVVQELYPDGADYHRAEMWAGLRPMTPDNLPVLGRRQHRNLWFNTGHGHIGWTMSHGTGAHHRRSDRRACAGDSARLKEARMDVRSGLHRSRRAALHARRRHRARARRSVCWCWRPIRRWSTSSAT